MKNINDILQKFTGLDFEIILANALKRDRIFVLTHGEYILDAKEKKRWNEALKKYKQGYSVATIIQNKEFYKINFFVNKHVLIPRPETEMVVEEALKEITNGTILIDIGTGTGCIPIAIIKNTPKKIQTFATDISPTALRVAKKNAAIHQVKIKFLLSDLLQKITNKKLSGAKKIIITANLPYLTEKQFKQEKTIQKEPKIALTAKENGLALYRRLLSQIQKLKQKKPMTIFFEIDPSQNKKITTMVKKYLPNAKIEIKKDPSGLDRSIKIIV